jgi:hypothetical protein
MSNRRQTGKRADRFPLWRHKGTGLWCKKHKVEFHYFGADKDAAQNRYLAEWPDIIAGRVPRARALGQVGSVVAAVKPALPVGGAAVGISVRRPLTLCRAPVQLPLSPYRDE